MRFLIAVSVGVPLAFLGLIGGLIVIGALLFAAALTYFVFGRVAFSGLAVGLGLTWAIMFGLAALNCAGPGQPCGESPISLAPHILLSIGLAALGIAVLVAAARVKQDDGRLGRE